jgi:hypothetical protein
VVALPGYVRHEQRPSQLTTLGAGGPGKARVYIRARSGPAALEIVRNAVRRHGDYQGFTAEVDDSGATGIVEGSSGASGIVEGSSGASGIVEPG